MRNNFSRKGFRKFNTVFVIISFASMILALLTVIAIAYVTYKTLDMANLRHTMRMLYNFFDVISDFYEWYFVIMAIVLIAVFFNYILTRRTARRMDAILSAVLRIKQGEYNALLPSDNGGALGELEQSVNQLAIRIESAFRRQKELEQSKDDFIVNIAHDLRTPLTSIIGYLSFISEKRLDPELSAKYAGVAAGKAEQLERLIDSLFDVAHFASDTIRTAKEDMNLKKFLMQKQDELYPQLNGADMEIRLNVPDSITLIRADGALLARVFDNLIGNAIRYSKDGRVIDIEADWAQGGVCLSVITHANPVPEAELEKIFDKLYRLEKSRSAGAGGTGLGLSISRRIAELHGGTLTARRTKDGTAFDIFLPE